MRGRVTKQDSVLFCRMDPGIDAVVAMVCDDLHVGASLLFEVSLVTLAAFILACDSSVSHESGS